MSMMATSALRFLIRIRIVPLSEAGIDRVAMAGGGAIGQRLGEPLEPS